MVSLEIEGGGEEGVRMHDFIIFLKKFTPV